MADKKKTLEEARKVFHIEADAIRALEDNIGDEFYKAVELILATKGKVVITGMGKSGLICQKIAATMASTGTSSFFLHPAEGVHGDLGVIGKDDIVIAVSNSGETQEVITILPVIKRMGVKLISMTGNMDSTLAKYGDAVLDISIKEEACPLGLAPTASTTATLAMGDALSVTLLKLKGFSENDFAMLHPAGSLGKKLMKVSELMRKGDKLPRVNIDMAFKDVIVEMSKKGLGITGVFEGDELKGVITDGDLRRAIEKDIDLKTALALDIMGASPKTIVDTSLIESAIKIMEDHSITALFCVDEKGEISGLVHMHDLINAGVI